MSDSIQQIKWTETFQGKPSSNIGGQRCVGFIADGNHAHWGCIKIWNPMTQKKIDLVSLVEVGLNSAITQFQSNTCRNCKLSRRRVTYFLYRGFPRRPIAVTRSYESRSASSWSFSRSSSILCSRRCRRSSSNLRRRRSHRCTSHFFRQPFNTLRWPCILVLMCFLP